MPFNKRKTLQYYSQPKYNCNEANKHIYTYIYIYMYIKTTNSTLFLSTELTLVRVTARIASCGWYSDLAGTMIKESKHLMD